MFEQLFRYPGVIERYHAGPHAEDRFVHKNRGTGLGDADLIGCEKRPFMPYTCGTLH